MSDALSGDLTPSKGEPKGTAPPPLCLGSTRQETAAIEIRVVSDPPDPYVGLACLLVHGHAVPVSKRGAVHLADWLYEWARPRRRIKLWGSAEIQKAYGISRPTLASWRRHRSFPRPLAKLAAGPVWEASSVKTWAELDRRKAGRRKKT